MEQRAAVPRAFEGDDPHLRAHVAEVPQAQAQRSLDKTADPEPPGRGVEHRDLKVVAHVEVRVGHHDTPDQRGDRGLAVQRMRAMHDEARVDRMLAGFLRIECGERLVDHGHRGCASAAGNHSHARGRGKDVNRARLRERSHERANTIFVARLDDHVEGVLALHDGLSLDVDAMVPDVGRLK